MNTVAEILAGLRVSTASTLRQTVPGVVTWFQVKAGQQQERQQYNGCGYTGEKPYREGAEGCLCDRPDLGFRQPVEGKNVFQLIVVPAQQV